eukprot:TRINITY_DN6086_c0_g1_i2.p1 TRINITY_DN6086_c0_g1~~TRINITY_DN6086_c0_g1_i2.p1  ORF type:complete len:654 (-),score=173.45 TRINITY_DN6086_c0_g1_i2:126-1877(-)
MALNMSPSFGPNLRNSAWQATLSAAASAAGPAISLAVFALVQARGGAKDALTSYGLLVATASVLLSVLLVLLVPGFGGEVPTVNAVSGDMSMEGSPKFGGLAKLLKIIRGLSQLALIFAAPPSGFQLLCATVSLRFLFVLQVIGSLGGSFEARADAELVAHKAGMLGGLALLDHVAWGPSSVIFAPLQPVLYCTLIGFAQIGFILVVHLSGQGKIAGPGKIEFDFHLLLDEDGEAGGLHPEALRRATCAGLYIAMALAACRAALGIFDIKVSLGSACIVWGEPLSATAALLMLLLLKVYCANYIGHTFGGEKETAAPMSNGMVNGVDHEASELANGEAQPEEETAEQMQAQPEPEQSPTDYLKAVIAPAFSIVLALVAVHTGVRGADADLDEEEATVSLAQMPFRYGFILTAFGLLMQVGTLFLYMNMRSDDGANSQPPFDCTGTIQWEPANPGAKKFAALARLATLAPLGLGLVLGLLGMGFLFWAAVGATVFPLVLILLPASSRACVMDVLGLAPRCLGCLGFVSDALAARQRRAEEARAAVAAKELSADGAAKAAGAAVGGAEKKQSWKAAPKGSKKKKN